jgi:hypothetical protein
MRRRESEDSRRPPQAPPRRPLLFVRSLPLVTGSEAHADVDITSAHLVAAGPEDPNFGTPGGQVFYIDSNVVNGEPNVPDFLGDSGIPAEAGHYSFHPVAGVAFVLQVAFRPAK